jgi:hypothetical protein
MHLLGLFQYVSKSLGHVFLLYPVRNNAGCPALYTLPAVGRHAVQGPAAGLHFRIIPAGFNPLHQRLRGECPRSVSSRNDWNF